MKSSRDVFVNAREVPITEKLRNVRQLITEPRQINTNLPKFAQNATASAPTAPVRQIAIRPLQCDVENAIVSFQFRELQIGQFQHVKRLVDLSRLLHDERSVPVDNRQI